MNNRKNFAAALRIPPGGSPNHKLFLLDGTQIASGYIRVVIGDRGPYVEFTGEQLDQTKFGCPPNQVWRMEDPTWKDRVYYHEYRTYNCDVMIYHQCKTVKYADYKVGYWYISPWDLYNTEGIRYAYGDPPPEKRD